MANRVSIEQINFSPSCRAAQFFSVYFWIDFLIFWVNPVILDFESWIQGIHLSKFKSYSSQVKL